MGTSTTCEVVFASSSPCGVVAGSAPYLLDERIGLVALLSARTVEEHGSALRAATRRELRRRLGFNGRTYVRDDFMLVTCDEATEQVRLATPHGIVQATHFGVAEGRPSGAFEWRLHWHTWSAS